jgi:hypothetical protein
VLDDVEEIPPMKDLPTDAEMQAANERFREAQRGYALSLHYDREADAFMLGLRSGLRLTIPRIAIEELRDATSTELEQVILSPSGGGIRCEPLDIDISVPGLVRDLTGAAEWLVRGGSSKGGRPRKKVA